MNGKKMSNKSLDRESDHFNGIDELCRAVGETPNRGRVLGFYICIVYQPCHIERSEALSRQG